MARRGGLFGRIAQDFGQAVRSPVPPGLHTIQSAGILRRIRETFQVEHRGFAPTLGDVVHPVCIVEDARVAGAIKNPPTRRYTEGTKIAGGAGLNVGAQLWNPVGSPVWVRVLDCDVVTLTVNDVSLGLNDNAFTTGQTHGWATNRAPDNPSPAVPHLKSSVALVNLHRDAAAFPGATSQLNLLRCNTNALVSLIDEDEWILGPGMGLVVYPFTLNIDFYYRFLWEEIPVARE